MKSSSIRCLMLIALSLLKKLIDIHCKIHKEVAARFTKLDGGWIPFPFLFSLFDSRKPADCSSICESWYLYDQHTRSKLGNIQTLGMVWRRWCWGISKPWAWYRADGILCCECADCLPSTTVAWYSGCKILSGIPSSVMSCALVYL